MEITLSSYFFLYLLSGMIVLIPALFTWRQRNIAGVFPLFFAMFFMTALLFLGATEMAFVDLNVKKNILVLEDLAYYSSFAAMMIFVADFFFKPHWLHQGLRYTLWGGGALLLLLDVTNPWHGQFWTSYSIVSTEGNIMYAQPGPWYLNVMGFFDLVVFFVLSALLVYAIRHHGWERWRAAFVLVGMLLPLLAPVVMIGVTDVTISSSISPLIYAVSGLYISWIVFEDQHLQLLQKTFDLKKSQENLAQKLSDQSRKMAGLFDLILMGSNQMQIDELTIPLLQKITALMGDAAVCFCNTFDQRIQISGSYGLSQKQMQVINLVSAAWLPSAPNVCTVPNILANSGLPDAFRQAGFHSLLATWINSDEMPPHVLLLLWAYPHQFTVEELSLTNAIADETRVIFENARMRAYAVDQALLNERHRISRDLHDTITQSLNSIVLTSEVASTILEKSNTEKLKKILTSLQTDAQQALKELRLLLFELRLMSPEKIDLAGALLERIDLVEKKAGLSVNLLVSGSQDWSPSLAEELYYIAIEALNNSLKHAFATRVEIMLEETPEHVILKIRDNGRGFQPDRANRGFGLRGMAERATRMGGYIDIQSSPGNGTLVTATVPGSRQENR